MKAPGMEWDRILLVYTKWLRRTRVTGVWFDSGPPPSTSLGQALRQAQGGLFDRLTMNGKGWSPGGERGWGAAWDVFSRSGGCVQFWGRCVQFPGECVQFRGQCVQFRGGCVHFGGPCVQSSAALVPSVQGCRYGTAWAGDRARKDDEIPPSASSGQASTGSGQALSGLRSNTG